jgi:hypothetical protein
VPLAAAAVYGLLGTDSLPFIAILGCFAIGPLLYVLLRQRFRPAASLTATILCLLWPPLRWGFLPLTDSWGIAFEIAALLSAVIVLDRGRDWLPLWVGVMLVASFTRDVTALIVIAVLTVAILHRSKEAWRLTWTGVLVSLPAPLIAPLPYLDQLATNVNNFVTPTDPTWGFVIERYPGALVRLADQNLQYLRQANPLFLEGHGGLLVPLAILFAVALVVLVAIAVARRNDLFLTLVCGSLAGGVALLLAAPAFTFLRYELVFLPPVAVGLALGVEMLTAPTSTRSQATAPA